MLIFTQDRKCVVKARTLQIQRNIGGGKDGKYMISACPEGLGTVIAAAFPDEKTALDALEKAFRAFADGAPSYCF